MSNTIVIKMWVVNVSRPVLATNLARAIGVENHSVLALLFHRISASARACNINMDGNWFRGSLLGAESYVCGNENCWLCVCSIIIGN